MGKVIINGKEFKAEAGDTISKVARRNGAHIGFVCDGNGWCTTCECKVESGAGALSEPNEIEKHWIGNRFDRGFRLGCQSTVVGEEEIRVTTRVEILKREFTQAVAPGKSGAYFKNTSRLFSTLARITTDHLQMSAGGLSNTIRRVGAGQFSLSLKNLGIWMDDIARQLDGIGNGNGQTRPVVTREPVKVQPAQEAKHAAVAAPVAVTQPMPVVKAPVVETAPAPLAPKPDDLKAIEGIGPRMQSILNSNGIYTFEQLANSQVETLSGYLRDAGFRLNDPTSWPEQAALAAAGKWEELKALQSKLNAGRKS
jgi:ferredoxin/predicted flap endonuclease-1-like 5' DNA nuclease